jgi:hypothetical protein
MILIGEESHSLLPRKCERPIVAIHRIRPSVTIIRGQNSSAIYQRTWEISSCGFAMEIEKCTGFRQLRIANGPPPKICHMAETGYLDEGDIEGAATTARPSSQFLRMTVWYEFNVCHRVTFFMS